MKQAAAAEERYIQREKALKRYINKLQNALKINKKASRTKKDKEKAEKCNRGLSGSSDVTDSDAGSRRKRPNTSTASVTRETRSTKTQDPPEWKRKNTRDNQGRTNKNNRKRNESRKKLKLVSSNQANNHINSSSSQQPKKLDLHKEEKPLEESKHLMLHDSSEHPMLKQELVAEINGECIQFHLIRVDPNLLLQEQPTINAEPIPSLIWPYD